MGLQHVYVPSVCVESSFVAQERLVLCITPWIWPYWRMGGGGERRHALNKTSIQTVGMRHDWESVWGEREEPL